MTTIEPLAIIVEGESTGDVVNLSEPLSFWGGFDPETGRVIDVHHPQHGRRVSGCIVVMPTGRGSSSASSVIAEAARRGTAPAGFVLIASDEILATAAIVVDELYGHSLPIVEVERDAFEVCASAHRLTIGNDGMITIG